MKTHRRGFLIGAAALMVSLAAFRPEKLLARPVATVGDLISFDQDDGKTHVYRIIDERVSEEKPGLAWEVSSWKYGFAVEPVERSKAQIIIHGAPGMCIQHDQVVFAYLNDISVTDLIAERVY